MVTNNIYVGTVNSRGFSGALANFEQAYSEAQAASANGDTKAASRLGAYAEELKALMEGSRSLYFNYIGTFMKGMQQASQIGRG